MKKIGNKVLICGAYRSPYGLVKLAKHDGDRNSGVLSGLTPLELGEQLLRRAVLDLGNAAEYVGPFRLASHLSHKTELCMRQAPAKVLSRCVPSLVNSNASTCDSSCNSGAAAMEDIVRQITLGRAEIGIALGLDMPSRCTKAEVEATLRNPEDGKMLWHYADEAAKAFELTRDELDQNVLESAERAWASRNFYYRHIVPIVDANGKVILDKDEGSFKYPSLEAIQKKSLMPGCELISRAHLCKNADGAGAVVLASESAANKYGLTPKARVVALQSVASVPSDFSTVVNMAVEKALWEAMLGVCEIGAFLIEETSIVTPAVFQKEFLALREIINLYGGATSYGHPYGATFLMALANLLAIMEAENLRYGVLAVGATGSTASAIVLERL